MAKGFCRAITAPGTMVTAYVLGSVVFTTATAERSFICTAGPGHPGSHSACDGRGHVLARWPRRATDRAISDAECAMHGHEVPR